MAASVLLVLELEILSGRAVFALIPVKGQRPGAGGAGAGVPTSPPEGRRPSRRDV